MNYLVRIKRLKITRKNTEIFFKMYIRKLHNHNYMTQIVEKFGLKIIFCKCEQLVQTSSHSSNILPLLKTILHESTIDTPFVNTFFFSLLSRANAMQHQITKITQTLQYGFILFYFLRLYTRTHTHIHSTGQQLHIYTVTLFSSTGYLQLEDYCQTKIL